MKKPKTIAKEFCKIVGIDFDSVYKVTDDFWKHYFSISGFVNDKYIYIYITQCQDEKIYTIEVVDLTSESEEIAKIIKKIEPNVKVTYYTKETITVTHTL